MLTTSEIISKYGDPGDNDNFASIILPYEMRIAWDLKTKVKKFTCHKLVVNDLTNIFNSLLSHYGLEELKRLEIDIFGGCLSVRKMRGGKDWSRHSWAIAVDLSPSKNQLKWKSDKAQFAKPEYKPMIDIFYANNYLSLGREKNYDWMHFEPSI